MGLLAYLSELLYICASLKLHEKNLLDIVVNLLSSVVGRKILNGKFVVFTVFFNKDVVIMFMYSLRCGMKQKRCQNMQLGQWKVFVFTDLENLSLIFGSRII